MGQTLTYLLPYLCLVRAPHLFNHEVLSVLPLRTYQIQPFLVIRSAAVLTQSVIISLPKSSGNHSKSQQYWWLYSSAHTHPLVLQCYGVKPTLISGIPPNLDLDIRCFSNSPPLGAVPGRPCTPASVPLNLCVCCFNALHSKHFYNSEIIPHPTFSAWPLCFLQDPAPTFSYKFLPGILKWSRNSLLYTAFLYYIKPFYSIYLNIL